MDLIDLAVTTADHLIVDLVDEDDSISLVVAKKATNLVGYDSDSIVEEDKEERRGHSFSQLGISPSSAGR